MTYSKSDNSKAPFLAPHAGLLAGGVMLAIVHADILASFSRRLDRLQMFGPSALAGMIAEPGFPRVLNGVAVR